MGRDGLCGVVTLLKTKNKDRVKCLRHSCLEESEPAPASVSPSMQWVRESNRKFPELMTLAWFLPNLLTLYYIVS